jgi:hypothetical protein
MPESPSSPAPKRPARERALTAASRVPRTAATQSDAAKLRHVTAMLDQLQNELRVMAENSGKLLARLLRALD